MSSLQPETAAASVALAEENESNNAVNSLDLLDFGNEEELRHTKNLPRGITSRMLYKDILLIAWPALLEYILTQLASMIDLMMVGNFGAYALSAVGLATQPRLLMSSLYLAMNVGATAMIARSRGADRPDLAKLYLRQIMLLNLVTSSVMAVIGYISSGWMIGFMGAADAETLAAGTSYLQIQMLGIPTIALTSAVTASLRGVGNTKASVIYNTISNVVHVLLNFVLIDGRLGFPRMEVSGAALATVIGQAVALLIALAVITQKNQYAPLLFDESFRPHWVALRNIMSVGIPAMIEQIIMRAGMIIYSKTVASLGTVEFAIHQVCMNIHGFSFMGGQSFAVSATSLVGQSLGKRHPEMAKRYSWNTCWLGLVFAVLVASALFFFGGTIFSWYNEDPYMIDKGYIILQMVALMQPLQSFQFILAGSLRGAGDTKAVAMIVFVTCLLIRPAMAYITINLMDWGLYGAWIAMIVDQVLRTAYIVVRFYRGKWQYLAVSEQV